MEATGQQTAFVDTPDLVSSSESYALRFSGPAGAYLLEVQSRIILDLLQPWRGARVLDLGGGHAQLAPPLLAAGFDVTVLASGEEALDRVRRLAPAAATAVGDLWDPPFPGRSFDIVVAVRMMAHVRDWRRFLRGVCRVARHAVIVDYPTPSSVNVLAPLLFHVKRRFEKDTRRWNMMGRAEVREAFAAAGFLSDAERPQFFLPMVVHRFLGRPAVSRALESGAERTRLLQALGSPLITRAVRVS